MSELNAELRSALGAARAWLEEFAEEGLERVEPDPAAAPSERAEPARSEPQASEVEKGKLSGAPASDPLPDQAPPHVSETEAPTLEAVRAHLGDCTRCRLHEGRNQLVFGDGNPDADLMFIGEGPGADEDRLGLPFVGRAGELLTAMIEKGLGIARAEVYICNIVKCRPPKNRTPLADEVGTCQPFLDGQIDAVKPRAIVALGKPATSLLLGRDVAITRLRGQWQEYRGIPVMPTLHPAFVLRQYTEENRRAVWDDLRAALACARGES